MTEGASGNVHVRAYQRVANGQTVQVQAYDRSAPWRDKPNAGFRDAIARAEGSADKPNHGYGERNASSGALGRYQMQPSTLHGIGWRNAENEWTERAHAYGVESDDDFLERPVAQEAALDDLLRQYEREADAKGLFERIGTRIKGRNAEITVTAAGIMGAVHRQGATKTAEYFRQIDKAGGDSNGAILLEKEIRVETRLRKFQKLRYQRMFRR
jgi:hypothetical protein